MEIMKITEYMFNLFKGMNNHNDFELKARYYMEYTALLKLLTKPELRELRRKIFNYKGWF